MKREPRSIINQFADASKKILRNNAVKEYLFGSYATKTQTPLSDIDILIIVKNLTPEIQSQLSGIASEYSLKYDLCISPILTDINTWNKNKQSNTLFYKEITRDGIRL
ncbi:MAG: nucleotidyltransferase domain-containing protein [Candidatus Electrothrix sp. ATG1]|nr:nucleotidyltransferase domain-containing protein [Candidatus Electrothrix sp. ATG1]MCI5210085.1 nucleotidyltransferase domain-containing protein [Candidatus Electrothrix sp. ATG2]